MSFTMSAFDSILTKGAQVKYPKPDQNDQWDSTFNLEPIGNAAYPSLKSPKRFVDQLQDLLPANVNVRDYLKSRGGRQLGDLDNTGDPIDYEKLKGLYGTVQIDGRIIAEVYNSGMTGMPNLMPPDLPDDQHIGFAMSIDAIGPQLAQKRLEEVAAATGGEIVYAKTALSQNDWGEQSGFDPRVPHAKTNKEVWLALIDIAMNQQTASTLLDAQLFGQESEAGAERAAA